MTKKQQPKITLCYVHSINDWTHELWFSDKKPTDLWGDDWNDAPYEHNAAPPYEYTRKNKSKVDFKRYILIGNDIVSPSYEHLNSPWSVEQINKQETYWLTTGKSDFYAGCTINEITTALENQGENFELYKLIQENY